MLKTYNGVSSNRKLTLVPPEKKEVIQTHNISYATRLKQKLILKIYFDEITNKKYVDQQTAYALGLIDVKRMMSEDNRLYEFSHSDLTAYKRKYPNIEIEIQVEKVNRKKEKIKFYYTSDNKFYIDISASYALKFINDSDFYNSNSNLYGPLNPNEIAFIKANFDFEPQKIVIDENSFNSQGKRM